ncbi:GpE family phage tail protein [Thiothrix sp.]|jgi:hypothetical protein|nr:GpE family phage tail protein [Thiothrix sp.]
MGEVGDMIADIATVFHWPLTELADMSYQELKYWQQRAASRLQLLKD